MDQGDSGRRAGRYPGRQRGGHPEKDGQNHVLQYSGAQVTPTRTGYVITADTLKAISDYKVYYLRNAKFTIDNNWHSLNGTFQLDNQQATVKGGLFN